MTYTTEQIARWVADITPGEWTSYDYEDEEDMGLSADEKLGAYWIGGPAFIAYDVYSLFNKQDAEFIAAAPAIVRQQADRIKELETALLGLANRTNMRLHKNGHMGWECPICLATSKSLNVLERGDDHVDGCGYAYARQALGEDTC